MDPFAIFLGMSSVLSKSVASVFTHLAHSNLLEAHYKLTTCNAYNLPNITRPSKGG